MAHILYKYIDIKGGKDRFFSQNLAYIKYL